MMSCELQRRHVFRQTGGFVDKNKLDYLSMRCSLVLCPRYEFLLLQRREKCSSVEIP